MQKLLAKFLGKDVLSDEERKTLDKWLDGEGRPRSAPTRHIPLRTKTTRRGLLLAAASLIALAVGWWALGGKKGVPVNIVFVRIPSPPPLPNGFAVTDKRVLLNDGAGNTLDVDSLPVGTTVNLASGYRLYHPEANVLSYKNGKAAAGSWQYLTVGTRHQPLLLQLGDGTTVCLAAGALFEYPLGGRNSPGECMLNGRAWFQVRADPAHPFSIQTPDGHRVLVLGTTFCLDAAAPRCVKVALFSGALVLRNRNADIRLYPMEEAEDADSLIRRHRLRDSVSRIKWAAKAMNFHFSNTDLNSALGRIADWYGLKVINPQRIQGIPITGDIPRTTAENVLHILQQTQEGRTALLLKADTLFVSPIFPGV